ncbi:MAG: AAA family ATPase [Thermoproteota archaeon]
MNLTRVELRNFKSIGSRQVINLSNGLTVLTGRNGSGKCVAPWTSIEQPYGMISVESLFELCLEGLRIYGRSEEYAIPNMEIPILSFNPSLGKATEARVSAMFKKKYEGYVLKIETTTGRSVEVTPEHRLMVALDGAQKWLRSSQLLPGMKIAILDGRVMVFDVVARVMKRCWIGEVYDLYVCNFGSYIVKGGVIVHNSNLIDAIRFALGENNPRLLRMDRLTSLINDKVGSGAEAYVKITIDNSDSVLPTYGKTITIARRMGRDGESTYYLDGKRMPKNVIEDIISSTGLSARGYNMIPQGEISRLADKNPVERRKEIEQALGLAQYDEKKAEALNNLQQADNNLRVAQARLQEIDRRMLQLERERNLLLRRRMLEKELEKVRTIINSLEYWKLVRKLGEVSRSLDESIAIRRKNEAELASKQVDRKKFMEEMEELLKVMTLATPDAERIRLEYELKDFERQLGEIHEELEENRGELNVVKKELSKVRRKKGRSQRKVTGLLNDSKRMYKRRASIELRISHLLDEKKKLQEEEKKRSEEIADMTSRLNLVNRELERTMLDEENSGKMLKEVLAHYSNLKRRIRSLDRRRSKEAVRRKRIVEKLTGLDKVLSERRKMLDNIMNTIGLLTNSLDSFRMVFAKASGILGYKEWSDERRKALELVKGFSGKKGLNIYGVLRENLWFSEEEGKAVESLVGEWMDAVLVKNLLDMLSLMNLLGGRGIGIKVLTSEGEVVKREIPAELRKRGKHIMDVIKYSKGIEKHILKLFWNSILANTVEDALIFVNRGFKAVTLSGEVFTSEGGLIRDDTEEKLEGLRSILSGFSEKASELSKMLEAMNNSAKMVLNKKVLETSDLRSRLMENINVIDSYMNKLEGELNTLTREYMEASLRLSQMFRRRDVGKKLSLEREGRRLKLLISAKEGRVKLIRRRRKLVERKIKELEEERAFVGKRLGILEDIINELCRRIKDYGNVEKTLIERIFKIKEETKEALNRASVLNARVEELKERISKGVEMKAGYEGEAEDKRGKLMKNLQELDSEIEKLNEEINKIKDDERRLLVDKEVTDNRAKEIRSRILGQPLEVSEEIEDSMRQYLNMLGSELERVQEVNMLAINQYEDEVYFYRNALGRINELEEERKSIQEFMEDIERRKREAFLEGLNKINSYFSTLFNKMTGGEGWLQPEDPDRPFETGLTIYVKFPGKEARVISGVSGGEKSVAALCLVFAMQKLFPATFYIFDEPDAHLDYVNVERMTDLLKEVAKESQMIVISLRDVVVSKADKVIGVYVKNGFSRFIEMPTGKALEETAVVG